jgi:hypothetical protein
LDTELAKCFSVKSRQILHIKEVFVMVSQTTKTGSRTDSKNQQAERPSDRQWSFLHLKAADGSLTDKRLQAFIDRFSLELVAAKSGKTLDPEPEVKVSELMNSVWYKADKYFFGDTTTIMELLAPYAGLATKDVDFKPAETRIGHNVLNQEEFSEFRLARATGNRSVIKPDPVTEKYLIYDDMDKLRRTLSWTEVKGFEIHVIGRNWTPRDPIRDVNDKAGDVYDLLDSFAPSAFDAREAIELGCLSNAGSVVSGFQTLFLEIFKNTGAYKYGLISSEDVFRLEMSIVNAMARAVVMSVVQPDKKLAKQMLDFVDWQLGGNPIVRFEDGIAHLLTAPKVKV